MGVKYTTKHNDFPKMTRELEAVNGRGVEVGVLRGEHQWLASIHEYGCDIPVTDRMRAYLATQGMRLKKTTTHIRIPERSFLRTGYDTNRDAVMKKASQMLGDVAAGKMSADALLEGVGIELSSLIKDYATELSSPGNHPFTVDRKGSANPLVDTGNMIGGINWRESK